MTVINPEKLDADVKSIDVMTPLTKGEPRVSLTQGSPGLHAAQGGVTLGPEQGELGANFCHLGKFARWPRRGCVHQTSTLSDLNDMIAVGEIQ
jgi:hypothetical protein